VNPPLPPALASTVLNALEDRELPLLSWGVTTGVLSEEEVLETIEGVLAAKPGALEDLSPTVVLKTLEARALLVREPASSPPRYRSRMAETVRLAARLRQLFGWQRGRPNDPPAPRWWERGRRLVADYRIHVAPRWYPRRDMTLAAVLAELEQLPGWGQLQSDLATAYIGDRQLARFQVAAARAVATSLNGRQGRGVIIGAGTGTGKTLSFYLPAFAALAEQARPGQWNRVHTLALYPRKELLRDQLREAVRVAQALTPVLRAARRRPLRIGALYADTPYDLSDVQRRPKVWRSRDRGLVCPYLACPGGPTSDCGGELIWSDAERRRGRERLRCAVCGLVLDDLALTRDSLENKPPDLLFTTTEMLNRNATARLGRIMGWRGGTGPDVVLLDEVHSYSDVHGAQVALLLRRWRNAVRQPVTFVGLSATLRAAEGFFAQLTGLDVGAVEHIEPDSDDLVAEGREYAIALRGDPVSGASLLSTSIQAAMLFGRVLDPEDQSYLHGSTGFLFTDDLDVTNRFYDDLRDAEGGQNRGGRGSGRSGKVLAALRSPDTPHAAERYRDGQSWDLIQRVGRSLPPDADAGELRVGRTSSQDVGVDLDAELVVATASLEVGYDDARVGLILQHKAPYDAAAFIQRRGRAGRRRETRPWTVVSLSDYGRDRLTYQAYDRLFAPEVSARHLPVGNRHVLRIQGTQALLDWLGVTLSSRGNSADPRRLLRAPRSSSNQPAEDEQEALARLFEDLLERADLQDDLHRHLRRALRVTPDEVQALLWEQPRSLLLAVVPTALRRLRRRWRPETNDPGAREGELLPEFVTRTLYEPLNVPEVSFDLPFEPESDERLPIERALREAVPGRVSRRWSHRRHEHHTWLQLPAAPTQTLDVSDIAVDASPQGEWLTPNGERLDVVRPLRMRLQTPPDDVSDQSQATPLWMSQFVESNAGSQPADVPHPSPWSSRITSAGFATHTAANPAEIRRMTYGADTETVRRNGQRERRTVRYLSEGRPGALGFRLTADAVRFGIAGLNLTDEAVATHLTSSGWRTLTFRAAVAEDAELGTVTNTFQRAWLAQVYLTSFALAALDPQRPPVDVHAALRGGAWRTDLADVLRALYRDADSPAATNDRLVAGLTELSHDATAVARLDHHAELLWTPDVATRTAHLAQRAYDDTLAAAIRAAALRACPDAQDRDLIVDVVPRDTPTGSTTVWLSETSIGGVGIMERLVRFYSDDPRRFWGLVDNALQPGPYEYVDTRLVTLLQHIADEPSGAAAQAMSALRTAGSAHAATAALDALRAAWAALDGYPPHAAVAALSARLLRPGSDSGTDRTALAIVRAWEGLEGDLGVELDAQVLAYVVGTGRLAVPGAHSLTTDQVFSLLWPRGGTSWTQHLHHYQPYATSPLLDRRLVEAAHDQRVLAVDVTAPDWADRFRSELGSHGVVDLVAPTERRQELADAVRYVPLLGVDRDVLRVYGEVRQIAQSGREVRVRVEIREMVQ
jgi:ATP-dependent Lhr-like helicase